MQIPKAGILAAVAAVALLVFAYPYLTGAQNTESGLSDTTSEPAKAGPSDKGAPQSEALDAALAKAEPGDLVIQIEGQANGVVIVDLLEDIAPLHVARIKELAEAGAYNDVVFHRVMEGFMAQTGDVEFGKLGETARAGMGGSDLPDLKAEFSEVPYDRGIVGMARSSDPDSANSQFFIMFAEGHFLNNQYTVVGRVRDGMEVVDQIKRGKGQSGSVDGPQDVMRTVTVVD